MMNHRMDQIENELRKMKKELNSATDAEEKSRKAMDDLASVLREVAAEASEAKEKLKSTQADLKAAKEEKEQLKLKLKSAKERLSAVMTECNKCKNEVERLRLEADETLAAWNEKESGLVGCMKNVEEERSRAQAENSLLQEEMRKLRDILKQAMAEAIGAKEAASLARADNSQLKNQLAEKDTALNFVSRELDSLRLSQAAVRNNLNLNQSTRDPITENSVLSLPQPVDHDKELKKVGKAFSFDMRCTGKNKRFEDLVDQNATRVVRGGSGLTGLERQDTASSLKRNMSCRFPDQTTMDHRIDQRHDSLRKKALVKRFGELLGARSSKSTIQ